LGIRIIAPILIVILYPLPFYMHLTSTRAFTIWLHEIEPHQPRGKTKGLGVITKLLSWVWPCRNSTCRTEGPHLSRRKMQYPLMGSAPAYFLHWLLASAMIKLFLAPFSHVFVMFCML
jgi:hypothetical protein